MRIEHGTHPRILTRVCRGSQVESVHEACAVIQPRGDAPRVFGETDCATFLRSVAKPFQTLALLTAPGVEDLGLTEEQIAVITASHAGEAYHQHLVAELLQIHGFSPADLQCGVHAPYAPSERRRLFAAGEAPTALCNNCSGKHAGMLIHSRLLGADPSRYLEEDHPVQVRIRDLIEQFSGEALGTERRAVDGCSAVTYHLPLTSIALALARLGDADFIAERGLEPAVSRLRAALSSHPRAFSGEGRPPWRYRPWLRDRWFAKEGAEGLIALWGEEGALVIKCLDGQERGYEWVLPALLSASGWIDDDRQREWENREPPLVTNLAGKTVGEVIVVLPRDA